MNKFFINLIPNKKLRHRLRKNYYAKPEFLIKPNTRCLFVAPHPDDEMIGGGGVLSLWPDNFDVIVMGQVVRIIKNEKLLITRKCVRKNLIMLWLLWVLKIIIFFRP